MLYQLEYETAFHAGSATPTKIIEFRSQYRHCHITVPDLEHPVAALFVEGEFYSFFKAVKDTQKAIEIATKMHKSGDKTVITKTPKGYVIWVREPEGYSALLS